ncbi:hypothetical protein ACIGEZ_30865 [Streptomyces sp. NPDC085481]|uniref:hypothetical protein n=1 Tax=Streptomyces sp. NPDC085481 TaxID=3365727 RepID=UPI0037D61D4B
MFAGYDAGAAALTATGAEHAQVPAGLPAAVEGPEIAVGQAEAPHTVTVFVDPRCGCRAKSEETPGTVLAVDGARAPDRDRVSTARNRLARAE